MQISLIVCVNDIWIVGINDIVDHKVDFSIHDCNTFCHFLNN